MNTSRESFWRRRVINPLGRVLKQGITPRKLALSLALGWVTGTFPIVGITLFLCIGLAAVFRLNQVAAQITNWLSYPFLFLLIIPHIRLGEWMLRMSPTPITATHLREVAGQGFVVFIQTFGKALTAAVLGWLIAAPLVFVGLYLALLPLTRALCARIARRERAPGSPLVIA